MREGFLLKTKRFFRAKRFRALIRDRRFQWLFAATAFMCVLVVAITDLEAGTNKGFDSFWDVLYWAVVTAATVGYGDISPMREFSRVLTIPFIIFGVVLMSFMTATIASILTTSRLREGRGLQKINLQDHVVVCGFNVHIDKVIGGIIAAADRSAPEIVLVNEYPETENAELMERFPGADIRFVSGSYTSESALLRAGVDRAESVIILADPGPEEHGKPDDRTLLSTLAVKSLNRTVEVCAELLVASNEAHLKRAGVDQIVFTGEFNGFLLSSSVINPGIAQALREMMRTDRGAPFRRVPFPPGLVGKNFRAAALDFLERDGTLLLGVITERKSFNIENMINADNDMIDAFIRRKFEEAGRSLEVETKSRITVSMNPGKDYLINEDDYAVVLASGKEDAGG